MSRFREDGLPTSNNAGGGPIRITEEDATSSHVDDLLTRQANMRGDTGIAADRSRRWYYSNWFVFGLAGFLFSTLGWLVVEPNYSDTTHFRTKITSISTPDPDDAFASVAKAIVTLDDASMMEDFSGVMDEVQVDVQYLLTDESVRIKDGGEATLEFDANDFKAGDEVGIHTHERAAEMVPSPDGLSVIMEIAAIEDTPGRGAYDSYKAASKASETISLVFFAIIAAAVGLGIGAADGLMCRLMRRAVLCGVAGLLVGFVGGFVSSILANVVYSAISLAAAAMTDDAGELTTMGFLTQMGGRSIGWALAGMTMGLGQGLALRSGKLLLYGFLGGLIGGLVGGLLFDPIQKFLVADTVISAHWARFAGIVVVGTSVGLMIGIVELLARDAWLNMVRGPLAGKEFLIFKDLVKVGASPSSDIYLFNDDEVAEQHAVIRAVADNYEIETVNQNSVLVNSRPVTRSKLRHGDQIKLGSTVFAFQRRRTG